MKKALAYILVLASLFSIAIPMIANGTYSSSVDKSVISRNLESLKSYLTNEGYPNADDGYAINDSFFESDYSEDVVIAYKPATDTITFGYKYYANNDDCVYVSMYLSAADTSYVPVDCAIFYYGEYIIASTALDISNYYWNDVVSFTREEGTNINQNDISKMFSSYFGEAMLLWNGLLCSDADISFHNLGFITLCAKDEGGHWWGNYSAEKAATTNSNGYSKATCSVCGDTTKKTIYKASTISLSRTSFTYNGKVQKPTLKVKDSKGNTISNEYYTATWSNASSKSVGKYTVKITFNGNYSGTKTLTYNILPKQVTGFKASTVKTSSITLTWNKVTGAKYYKVEQSTDGKTWKTVTTTDKTSYTVKSLKAGTKYQFRVTALDSTKKVSGKSSAVLKTATLTGAPSVTLKSSKSKTATASWKKVTGASKYVVYKSTDGKKWTKVTTTTKISYTLTKLTGGKKIYVKVTALNVYGKTSAASTVKNVTVKK